MNRFFSLVNAVVHSASLTCKKIQNVVVEARTVLKEQTLSREKLCVLTFVFIG